MPESNAKLKEPCERCGTVPFNGWLMEVPGGFKPQGAKPDEKPLVTHKLCVVCWPMLTERLSEAVEKFVRGE